MATAPAASATSGSPSLHWKACGDAPDVECAVLKAPLDYDKPHGKRIKVFVARAHATGERKGSLFLNFGGPGASIADFIQAAGADGFPALSEHFDLVGMDPRGTGQTEDPIDCKVNQETTGLYSEPFTTPFNLDVGALIAKDRRYIRRCLVRNDVDVLAHASTANVARDMDLVRAGLGESRLNYLGFSYGTFLGATYASLFPNRYRALVLDGPLDPNRYINKPTKNLFEQSAGFERALGRFFQACAADQSACLGFGGSDPWSAYDELVDQAYQTPLPADGYTPDPRPVNGDDVLAAAVIPMYAKQLWPLLAQALAAAQDGDGTLIRALTDEFFYGRDPDTGDYDPGSDRYFTLGAVEQRYTRDIGFYLDAGDDAYGLFEHTYWNTGYPELNYGLWPIHDRDAYYGPFKASRSAPTPLVVATRYDPATPYRGALHLLRQLGNARLLTMTGDGHTAYGNGSPDCIDPAIERYINTLALPDEGTKCKQHVPFAQAQAVAARAASATVARRALRRAAPQIAQRLR
ncbi:MAG TPA: alpha/beta hydrolase [Solirubrobacteraceae bacterium]|nr:alpha/beta hydrolase [Solirubrobacteraceae bacterium]